MRQKFIILAILLVILTGLAIVFSKNQSASQKVSETAVSQIPPNFNTFSTFENGYEIKIPTNWVNTSDLQGHSVIGPGKNGIKVGSFQSIVLSVNPSLTALMTSQSEFDSWYAKKNEKVTKGIIQKLANTTIDGEKAVELIDTSVNQKTQNAWSIVTWTRKNNVNYYINAIGDQKITTVDFKVYEYIIKSFKFNAKDTVLQ